MHDFAIASYLLPTSTLDASISALRSGISTLEVSIDKLESGSTFWEKLGLWSAFVVGIGVVGELAVIFHDFSDRMDDWRRGIVKEPSRPSKRWLWFDVVATLVVIIGVFAEAASSMKVSSINSQLRSKTSELRAKSDQLLALITLEAGSAATNAKLAQDSASVAKVDAERISQKLRSVTEKAAQLDMRLWSVREPASARQVINPEQVIDRFRKFANRRIAIGSYVLDPEARRVCIQLVNITRLAGMIPSPECAMLPPSPSFVVGHWNCGPNGEENIEINGILSSVRLGNLGVGASCGFLNMTPELEIVVGPKWPEEINFSEQAAAPKNTIKK